MRPKHPSRVGSNQRDTSRSPPIAARKDRTRRRDGEPEQPTTRSPRRRLRRRALPVYSRIGAALTFRSSLVGNVYVVRWGDVPTEPDNQKLLQELRDARKKVGAGLLFCGIIPEGVGIPGAAERE